MTVPANTPFSRFLLAAETAPDVAQIARAWHDQTVTYQLSGAARLLRHDLGGHLRRSFLGALGRGASLAAQNNLPCPWDPPCALDVFLREQARGPRGDGLPKPYVIFTDTEGPDLFVSLRVFGMANDWFMVAAEAFLLGMREILPCQRLFGCNLPAVSGREISQVSGLEFARDATTAILEFTGPVDAAGKGGPAEPSLLSRLLRRVDGLARWQGLALSPNHGRALAALIADLDFSQSHLRAGQYLSPSKKSRMRRHPTLTGTLVVKGPLAPLLPVMAIGARCHMGRAAVEGLGRYRMSLPCVHRHHDG